MELSENNKSNSKNSILSDKNSKVLETPDYLERLDNYYKLKNTYESKYKDQKNSILKNDDISLKQKRDKIMKIKRKCVNCNRPVGSNFKNDEYMLYASCGDKVNPCDLNIKINRGLFVSLDEMINAFQEGVDDNKENIIKTKLNLLFNFKKESEIIEDFNKLKTELTDDLEALMEYKSNLIDIIENLEHKALIASKMEIKYEKISFIKDMISKFNETGEIQLIHDVVNLYVSEMTDLISSINKLKYKRYMVEQVDSERNVIYKLIKNTYTINDLLISFEQPKIEEFTIGKKAKVDEIQKTDDTMDSLDLSKLERVDMDILPSDSEIDDKSKPLKLILTDNKLFIGNNQIADKYDYEANKKLKEELEGITVLQANNNGYKFEMLYINSKTPVLFAVDVDNQKIYNVDL